MSNTIQLRPGGPTDVYADAVRVRPQSRAGEPHPRLPRVRRRYRHPVSAYELRQAGTGENAVLLESVAGGAQIARYSYLGIDPLEVVATKGRSATIGENGSSRRIEIPEGQDPLDLIRELLARYRFVPVEGCDRFYGGAVGYVGYDVVRFFEEIPDDKPDDLNLPDAYFMLTDTLVIFDHVTRKLRVVANAHVTGDPQEAYWDALARIDRLVDALRQPLPRTSAGNGSVARIPSDASAMRSTMTREQHREAVLKAKQYIAAGDVIQVCSATACPRRSTWTPSTSTAGSARSTPRPTCIT